MTDATHRRRDRLLREIINEYRRMAEGAQNDATNCKGAVIRERYLALSKALTELADALQDSQSN